MEGIGVFFTFILYPFLYGITVLVRLPHLLSCTPYSLALFLHVIWYFILPSELLPSSFFHSLYFNFMTSIHTNSSSLLITYQSIAVFFLWLSLKFQMLLLSPWSIHFRSSLFMWPRTSRSAFSSQPLLSWDPVYNYTQSTNSLRYGEDSGQEVDAVGHAVLAMAALQAECMAACPSLRTRGLELPWSHLTPLGARRRCQSLMYLWHHLLQSRRLQCGLWNPPTHLLSRLDYLEEG